MARSSTSGQGRPKGVPNKVTKTVREAFERAFAALQDTPANLAAWAEENPTEFYRLASKLIPAQINATADVALTIVCGVPDASEET